MASDYNLALRFAVKQISPNTFYILRVTYNGGDLVQMPLEFETGTVTLNTRFSPVESTRENTKKPPRLAISIHLGDYQEGTVPNVRLGLDAFKITR